MEFWTTSQWLDEIHRTEAEKLMAASRRLWARRLSIALAHVVCHVYAETTELHPTLGWDRRTEDAAA